MGLCSLALGSNRFSAVPARIDARQGSGYGFSFRKALRERRASPRILRAPRATPGGFTQSSQGTQGNSAIFASPASNSRRFHAKLLGNAGHLRDLCESREQLPEVSRKARRGRRASPRILRAPRATPGSFTQSSQGTQGISANIASPASNSRRFPAKLAGDAGQLRDLCEPREQLPEVSRKALRERRTSPRILRAPRATPGSFPRSSQGTQGISANTASPASNSRRFHAKLAGDAGHLREYCEPREQLPEVSRKALRERRTSPRTLRAPRATPGSFTRSSQGTQGISANTASPARHDSIDDPATRFRMDSPTCELDHSCRIR